MSEDPLCRRLSTIRLHSKLLDYIHKVGGSNIVMDCHRIILETCLYEVQYGFNKDCSGLDFYVIG